MKKLLIGVTAIGLVASAQSHAMMMGGALEGMYAGVRGAYQWHSSDFKKETGNRASKSLDANSFAGDAVLGWMTGDMWTWGVEGFFGYANGSDKGDTAGTGTNYSSKLERKWRYGLDLLVGHKFMTDLTGYAKLGIHANVTDFKTSETGGANFKKSSSRHIPAVAAGLGVKHALNKDFTLDVGYTYEMDLKEEDYKVGGTKVAKYESGNAHQVHVGVTFTF